jgi:hypothetical protein
MSLYMIIAKYLRLDTYKDKRFIWLTIFEIQEHSSDFCQFW